MASNSEVPPILPEGVCPVCCNLDASKASAHPDRIGRNRMQSYYPDPYIALKVLPRASYREKAATGCRFCALICKCLSYIPADRDKEVGLRWTPGQLPWITNEHDWPRRGMYSMLVDQPGWEAVPFRTSIFAPDLDYSAAWIQERLDECYGGAHEQCWRSTTVGPRRLLKLDGGDNSVRIVDCPEPLPAYVTLSYCWGGEQECTLTRAMVEALKEEIPWSRVTTLHRDVIALCRRLGLDYLWIDALCIIQDDEDDWMEQAAVMADIYENAHLTISATCCPNPSQSLFERDATYGGREKVLELPKHGSVMFGSREMIEVGHHREFYSETDKRDRLETRGWCFQESRLSRRMVSFTSQELQWQCRESRTCECGDGVTDDLANMSFYEGKEPIPALSAHTLWGQLLQRYTRTKLTKQDDKLVALAGLASRIAISTKSAYVAGLWQNNLAAGLLWRPSFRFKPFSTVYRAPTFSWASVDSPVQMINGISLAEAYDYWTPTIKVLEAHVDLKSQKSSFGEVIGGFIRLEGVLCVAELSLHRDGEMRVMAEGFEHSTAVRIFPDGIIQHSTVFGAPTATRLRVAAPDQSLSQRRASGSSASSAWTVVTEDVETSEESSSDDSSEDCDDSDSDNQDVIHTEADARAEHQIGEYQIRSSTNSSESSNSEDSALSLPWLPPLPPLPPVKVHLLYLGFFTIPRYASWFMILGLSPTHKDCYERLGLVKLCYKKGQKDPGVERWKTLPVEEVTVV